MRRTDDALYALRLEATAVFAGDWLSYQPPPGRIRYLEGYRGTLRALWNGGAEFTVDADTAHTIVAALDATADYVSSCWRTACFDSDVLVIRLPCSLGGGVHRQPPRAGCYRIGWGLAWYPVDPADCDRVIGNRTD
ncbi:hypothetical protein BJY16_001806 [Actinoplanes octamycinicus]|uniref:Uncharacterized protein n=1 Tax=Actinoplanes octamycinicus TaxID=135948 RepID=A0A7W7M611_9ACTN|nr:hypothetical protein [Actinoplanes octamycinicus]MBB4738347.1 hypothetical protein [Actinoplanes octamycinicus]